MQVANTTVWCRTQVVGFHKWEGALKQYRYLANVHRHVFHIEVHILVVHDNRDTEFIHLGQLAKREFELCAPSRCFDEPDFGSQSCEMLAKRLGAAFIEMGYKVKEVRVSEDNENGARITYVE